MLQVFAQEMTTLRRAIRNCWERIGGRGRVSTATHRSLAHDLGLPPAVVSRVLDQAAADLRSLAASDEAADARPIINRAVSELAKFGLHSRPFDEAAMERCLKQLEAWDLAILRHFKQGMKHSDIAALMGTDIESVRRSLVKTYAELRIKMMGWDDGDGGDTALPGRHTERVRAVSKH